MTRLADLRACAGAEDKARAAVCQGLTPSVEQINTFLAGSWAHLTDSPCSNGRPLTPHHAKLCTN